MRSGRVVPASGDSRVLADRRSTLHGDSRSRAERRARDARFGGRNRLQGAVQPPDLERSRSPARSEPRSLPSQSRRMQQERARERHARPPCRKPLPRARRRGPPARAAAWSRDHCATPDPPNWYPSRQPQPQQHWTCRDQRRLPTLSGRHARQPGALQHALHTRDQRARARRGGANPVRQSSGQVAHIPECDAPDPSPSARCTSRSKRSGVSGRKARSGVASTVITFENTSPKVSPPNGGEPAISSCKIVPSAQISVRASTLRADRICSGDMYSGEPMTAEVLVSDGFCSLMPTTFEDPGNRAP